jgi:hypothetical protein
VWALRGYAHLRPLLALRDGAGVVLIYTEIESHRASLRERWQMLSLMWRISAEERIPPKARRTLRRVAVRYYVFTLRPRASSYLVNRDGDV